MTAEPFGGVPLAVPVLEIDPASTSLCVVVYVAVHVSEAAGASVPLGQLTALKPV